MPRTGRPRALNDAKLDTVCAIVAHGASLAEAAQYVGCALSTLHRERRSNEAFRKRLHAAEVEATLTPHRLMRAASRRNWRAAAWMLQQINPKRYGRH